MYLDEEMLRIMMKNLKVDEWERDVFIKDHQETLRELIIMKILNHYGATHTQEERDQLESLMADIAKYGKVEDQKKMIEIIKSTFLTNPELVDQIRKQQSEIHSDMVFSYLGQADSKGQVELMTYLLTKKKETKLMRQKLDALKKKRIKKSDE